MTSPRLVAAAALFFVLFALPRSALAGTDHVPWVWPLQPAPSVVSIFDPPDENWHAGHRGVDLLGAPDQAVLAIGPGRVAYAGSLAGRGVIVVDHGELRSTYEPVLARVSVGDRVEAGAFLGVLQSTPSHCAPQVCLHLGVKRGETYLDPLDLLTHREVRLKPVDGDLAAVSTGSGSIAASDTSTAPAEGPTSAADARAALGGAAAAAAALLAVQRRRDVRPADELAGTPFGGGQS